MLNKKNKKKKNPANKIQRSRADPHIQESDPSLRAKTGPGAILHLAERRLRHIREPQRRHRHPPHEVQHPNQRKPRNSQATPLYPK